MLPANVAGPKLFVVFTSGNRDWPPAAGAWLLALAVMIASIYRIPFFDQLDVAKIGILGVELFCVFLLLVFARQSSLALTLLCVAAMLVSVRAIVGLLTASIAFEQTPAQSLQEARFGIMLAALPLVYLLLRDASDTLLRRYIISYMLFLMLVDALLFATLAEEDVVMLGLRTDSRFFCSVLTPLILTALLLLRQSARRKPSVGLALLTSSLMLGHSALVTTSRVETLLAAGLLGLVVCVHWPRARWWLYPAAVMALAAMVRQTLGSDYGIAGRDFGLAIELAQRSLPFGFGTVIDSTARNMLGLPEDFFLSDYGLLLYVFRYGVLGVMLIVLLLLLWLQFTLRVSRVNGAAFLYGPILVYLAFIPLLDYGSLNGSFLLSFILLTSRRDFYRQRRS